MAHPSRVATDPSLLEAAEVEFAGIMRDARDNAADGYESRPMLRMELARLLAQNLQGTRAIAEANEALDAMQGWPDRETCHGTISAILLAGELEAAGLPTAGLNIPHDRIAASLACSAN